MKEYKIVATNLKKAEKLMNDMALQGWEVVAVTYNYGWSATLAITFSRNKSM